MWKKVEGENLDAEQVWNVLNEMESGLIQSQELAVEEMFNVLVGWYLRHHFRVDV